MLNRAKRVSLKFLSEKINSGKVNWQSGGGVDNDALDQLQSVKFRGLQFRGVFNFCFFYVFQFPN